MSMFVDSLSHLRHALRRIARRSVATTLTVDLPYLRFSQTWGTGGMRSMSAFATPGGLVPRPAVQSAAQHTRACRAQLRGVSAFAPGMRAAHVHRTPDARDAPARVPAVRAAPVALAKQMESDWNRVKLLENSSACEEHRYIVIDVGVTGETGSLCDSYRYPGMYVQMRQGDGGKPGFFAISCAPNIQGIFEFLIKETEGTQWLTSLKTGDYVEMSPVMGKGFPVSKLDRFQYPPLPEEKQPSDMLLFATGSGIAPIRASIESMLNGINPAQRNSVKLYYGARYPRRMAYMDRFKLWQSDKIEVIPVMSRPQEAAEKWTGRTGYVQDALKEDGIANPAKTGVLFCGVKGMTEDVKAYCIEQGVPEDRILSNF